MVSKQKLFRFWWINIRTEVQLKAILSTDLETFVSHRQTQFIQRYNIQKKRHKQAALGEERGCLLAMGAENLELC